MDSVDSLIKQQTAKLLPRRIIFKPASNPAAGFLPPSCQYKPMNEVDLSFDSQSSSTKQKHQVAPLIPPMPAEIKLTWASKQSVGAGFRNLGSTDFINAVFQALIYTSPVANLMLQGLHEPKCRACGFCVYCTLEKLVSSALQNQSKSITPYVLSKNIRSLGPSFLPGKQGDAYLLLSSVLDALEAKSIPVYSTKSSEDIFAIFGGYLKSEMNCQTCYDSYTIFERMNHLSLNIIKAKHLKDAFQTFRQPFIQDKMTCRSCYLTGKMKITKSVARCPRVLVLHLQKFEALAQNQLKQIKITDTLNISGVLSTPQEQIYTLQDEVLRHSDILKMRAGSEPIWWSGTGIFPTTKKPIVETTFLVESVAQ